jgi:hypothetical protein
MPLIEVDFIIVNTFPLQPPVPNISTTTPLSENDN